jgi:hypothetical protein
VDRTCHRFGQDSRVEVEIIDWVTFRRRRHEVLGEAPRIGDAQRPQVPAKSRSSLPAFVAQAAGEHVVEHHHLADG